MAKPLALIIHSADSPLAGISKLVEARDCSVHLSRTIEEAERVLAAFPTDQQKFIFAELAVCQGATWHGFTDAAAKRTSHQSRADLLRSATHPQRLYGLLGQRQSYTRGSKLIRTPLKSPPMIGDTPQFHEVLNLANRYAMHDITVLITGETGTGKEVMAQYIHSHGPRADKPFVGCNMTAIPETLVESELFGYVKGAFTGADRNKKGFIEAAEGGTLFLDEIGDLAPSIQLKLLRFLETRQYYRVGESTPKDQRCSNHRRDQ